jgi:uncharacterized protein (TIGR01319 family)
MSGTSDGRAFSPQTETFCVTDVGSTTTKAILFAREGGWRFFREEASTTVEKPHEDVTVGVRSALQALERRTGQKLLRDGEPSIPYLSTSSAGGGLAMVVTGLVRDITADSADRVALGAGAIVLDIFALNDGRTPYRKIEDLKRLRPDMVLLAGGFDGDAISGPVFLAELVSESGLRPKLSASQKLPVIYGGNVKAREDVKRSLGDGFLFYPVSNIRPSGGREKLEPARNAIQDLFMDHVMSQAPGYEQLKTWTSAPILPTPAAFARVLALVSKDLGAKVLAVDVGGATTDVFTVDGDQVFRTVSANLGMSYSLRNVAEIGGVTPISDLLDVDISEAELWNRLGNKHISPTSLPVTNEAMQIEWAAASIAIREAVRAHLEVYQGAMLSLSRAALDIRGAVRSRVREREAQPAPDLADYDLVIGSGGILSHSPRQAAAMMLVDALELRGLTALAVDSAFMFPHLGVLAEVRPELARELFYSLGIVRLGTAFSALGSKRGISAVRVTGVSPRGDGVDRTVNVGEIAVVPLRGTAELHVRGGGEEWRLDRTIRVEDEACGLIADVRPRPLTSRARTLAPAGYLPNPYHTEDVHPPRVVRQRVALRRELAIPGDVFVRTGQRAESDTLVARSTRQFLRPFFLPVAESLGVRPDELPEHLLKNVGDEISTEEVLARKSRHLMTPKVFRSPVEGRIEKILPSGTLMVREKPEAARELTAINVAKELGIDPKRTAPYLRVKVGDEVHRGQWVAAAVRPGTHRVCPSPVRGRVSRIENAYGIVMIEPLLEELEVRAWLPGIVDEVSDRGCVVSANASVIAGAWGRGGEAHGPVLLDDVKQAHITVTHFASGDLLRKAAEAQAAGLIVGGLDLVNVLDPNGGPTIVVTEGFGTRKIATEVLEALQAHRSRVALVDGTTQLRVGVKRPTIILPE